MGDKWKKWLPLAIGLLAFIYYAFMAVKDYSWIFVSSDSGIWLAAAIKWMVPAPYGGPVYMVLGHAANFFFPNHLASAMSILLSALPSAITVGLTYLITLKLTKRVSIAIVCSLILAGSAIFLIESTVGVYHALAIMFLTAAFYAYILDYPYWTTILLALGTGVHILILPIAVFWMIADGQWKKWLKPIIIYILVVAFCYSLILILMYLPTPQFLAAGHFNLHNVKDYFTKTSQAIIGEVSIFEAPSRLWLTIRLLLMSFGAALIPLWFAFKRPIAKTTLLLMSTTLFILWYFITCLDVMTWTYLAFLTPSVVILVGIGLSHLSNFHLKAVFLYAMIPLVLAPIFLNANVLTNQNPQGRNYIQELYGLPQNCILLGDAGGISLGLFYYINSTGSHIMPLIDTYIDNPTYYATSDYINYLKQNYYPDLDYSSTLSIIQSALDEHIPVYYPSSPLGQYYQCFNLVGVGAIRQIESLTGLPPRPTVTIVENKK